MIIERKTGRTNWRQRARNFRFMIAENTVSKLDAQAKRKRRVVTDKNRSLVRREMIIAMNPYGVRKDRWDGFIERKRKRWLRRLERYEARQKHGN